MKNNFKKAILTLTISILCFWTSTSLADHQTAQAQYVAIDIPIDSSYIVDSRGAWHSLGLMEKVQMELSKAGMPLYSNNYYRPLEISIMAKSENTHGHGAIRLCYFPNHNRGCHPSDVLHAQTWTGDPSNFRSDQFIMRPFISQNSSPLHRFDWFSDLQFNGVFRIRGVRIIFERFNFIDVPPVFIHQPEVHVHGGHNHGWTHHQQQPRRRWHRYRYHRRHYGPPVAHRRHRRRGSHVVYRYQRNLSLEDAAIFAGGILLFNALTKITPIKNYISVPPILIFFVTGPPLAARPSWHDRVRSRVRRRGLPPPSEITLQGGSPLDCSAAVPAPSPPQSAPRSLLLVLLAPHLSHPRGWQFPGFKRKSKWCLP